MNMKLIRSMRCPRCLGLLVITAFFHVSLGTAAPGQTLSARDLIGLSEPELEALYRQGTAVAVAPGRVRGTALLAPGTRRNAALATGTRLVWQGKVFALGEPFAVNRFFGLPIVRAEVSVDASWLDGGPALVLDYSRTSRVYARYRDEIRQVGPDLFLGLMYDRSAPVPSLRMYFVLQAQH
jgi:hypothetical protein